MFPKSGYISKSSIAHQRMTEEDVKLSIKTLQDAITGIFHRQSSQMSFENLYRKSYNLVTNKHGEELSKGLEEVFTINIKDHLEILKNSNDDQLLSELINQWNKFYEALNTVKDILMYYDRHHVPLMNEKTSFQLGLHLFSELVVKDKNLSTIIPKIVECFIDDREGKGSKIALEKLNSLVKMLVDLGTDSESLYITSFEPLFLSRSRSYYHDKSAIEIGQLDASSYVNLAFSWIETENEYFSFLYEDTVEELRKIIKEEIIENHSKYLLDV